MGHSRREPQAVSEHQNRRACRRMSGAVYEEVALGNNPTCGAGLPLPLPLRPADHQAPPPPPIPVWSCAHCPAGCAATHRSFKFIPAPENKQAPDVLC